MAKKILENLEMHLIDSCNLNCRGCGHFSNISPNEIYELADFKRDLKKLADLFQNIKIISLMGGEPLLNKNIAEYLTVARSAFPKSQIQIVSNGLLLDKQKDDFLKCLWENKIKLSVSLYPVQMERVESSLERYSKAGIEVHKRYAKEGFHTTLDITGKTDPLKSFAACPVHYDCINLRNGKLYHCPFSLYVNHYNQKYNTSIPEFEGIDIYKAKNADEIINHLHNIPIPACAYCTTHNAGIIQWVNGSKNPPAEDWLSGIESPLNIINGFSLADFNLFLKRDGFKSIIEQSSSHANGEKLLREIILILKSELAFQAFRNNRVKLRLKSLVNDDAKLIRESKLFDNDYYKKHAGNRYLPIRHWLWKGVFQGISPFQGFNITDYLLTNPECIKKAINPLVHYIYNR